ncbi:GntR family transcriptional regulator [Oceanobacillus alkalisoli]|uniref:GntR family transcriptional regulator n=1 Tax=Oceanobacillus alkalisoli TaxID=2925113 RepID=UPI001F11D6A2|nr:GntR family transcriptional regulator [Oceanobacillus alkalisoli]MCF3944030.1 GntR family transcriptional regulator [Oceanobacillus alkalisoli]
MSFTDTDIMDDIMQQIVSKKITPGTKLPSENELADRYHVPRMTVRSALTKLEERGLVYSVQGKGRYLQEKTKQIQLSLTGKTSFTEKMQQLGYDLKTENRYCEKINFDEKIYDALQAEETDAVYQIGRLRFIDNEPIAIHHSFVRKAHFPKIKEDGPQITSMFAYYRKLGYNHFSSSETILSITFPTAKEQELLSCQSLVPLLVVETNCLDMETKEVIEYTKILYRSDKFTYDITAG